MSEESSSSYWSILINAEDGSGVFDLDTESFIGLEGQTIQDVYLGAIKLSNSEDIQFALNTIDELVDTTPFLGNYTVQEVQDIIDAGEAEDYWCVGDVTNPIELNGMVGIYEFDHESYRAMIIGFNHNADLETDGKCSVTFQFGKNEDGVNIAFIDSLYGDAESSTAFNMNTSYTNSGGWESSQMRIVICPQFLEALPKSLQNVIGTTTKYTDNVGNTTGSVESNITATEDKIFLLSGYEVFDTSANNINTYEANYTERYAWYAENDSSSMRFRYGHSTPSSAVLWWLRSPNSSSSGTFVYVNAGGQTVNGAQYSRGFAPAFNLIGSTTPRFSPLKPLSEYSPAEIQEIVDSGEAANYWSIGDTTAPIELNGTVGSLTFKGDSYKAVLIGLDHNMDLETGGRHNAVFQFGRNEDGVNTAFIDSNYSSIQGDTGFKMNLTETNVGGWEASYMRNTVCAEFLAALPADWQEIVGTTTKYTDNVGNSGGHKESSVTATQDKIFLLNYYEIGLGSQDYSNSYENNYTEQYSEMYSSSNDRRKYEYSSPTDTCLWWVRSPHRSSSTSFCEVYFNGTEMRWPSDASLGFSPAFTVIAPPSVTEYEYATVTLEIEVNGTTDIDEYSYSILLTDQKGNTIPISTSIKVNGKEIAVANGESDVFTFIPDGNINLIEIPKVGEDPYLVLTLVDTVADSITVYINGVPQQKTTTTDPISLTEDSLSIRIVYAYRSFFL